MENTAFDHGHYLPVIRRIQFVGNQFFPEITDILPKINITLGALIGFSEE